MKNKVLIDARMLGYSGIGRYLSEILPLVSQQDDFSFAALVKPGLESSLPKRIKPIATTIKPYSFQEQTKLRGIINAQRADLVHFTHINQPFWGLKTKRLTTVHDLTMIDFPPKHSPSLSSQAKHMLLKIEFRSILKHNSILVTPTQFVADQLKYRFGLSVPIRTTPLGNQSHQKQTVTRFAAAKRPFLLYVGNALPHKNVERIIAAAKVLSKYQFILAGNDEHGYEEIKKTAPNNVVFAGFVPDNELAWLYKNAEALIQPSLSEGFGLTGLEAMAHDCPVISSNATCLPEVYGDAALYFDPKSTSKLIEAINSLEDHKANLIDNGRNQLIKFSWQKCAQQTLDAYREALGR